MQNEEALTRDVVALGLDPSREVGVLRDGVAVVVQGRELCGDIRVARHQDRRQDCNTHTHTHGYSVSHTAAAEDLDTHTDTSGLDHGRGCCTHLVSPRAGSGMG